MDVSELPRPVTLIGSGLNHAATLSLVDDTRAHLSAPTVLLDEQPVVVVAQPDTGEIVIELPSELGPGSYDVSVKVGSKQVSLRAGLNVSNTSSQRFDAALAADSSVDGTYSENTPNDAGATNPEAAKEATSSNSPTSSDNTTNASLSFDEATSADRVVPDAGPPNITTDAALDSTDPLFRCSPGEFGAPEVVTVQGYVEGRLWSPTFTADGLTMYFTDGSESTGKLMKATRTVRGATFVNPEYLTPFFPAGATGTPYITPNGLALYFYSIQTTGMGSRDMYVATRASLNLEFTNPKPLDELNSTNLEHLAWVSPDELWFVWVSHRDGHPHYWTASRSTKSATLSTPEKFTRLTLPGDQGRLFITYDGLVTYFVTRDRPGGKGAEDIWYATRRSPSENFRDIKNMSDVNSAGSETDVTLTHDGEELFFVRTGDSNVLYRAVADCD